METNQKITAGEVVSSTRKYSNINDGTRLFNIEADVNIQNGKVTNFNSGTLTRKEANAYGNANFSAGNNLDYFAFNSNGLNASEVKDALDAIMDFMSNVKENVESLETE